MVANTVNPSIETPECQGTVFTEDMPIAHINDLESSPRDSGGCVPGTLFQNSIVKGQSDREVRLVLGRDDGARRTTQMRTERC